MGTRAIGEQPNTKIVSALDNQTIASALGSDTNGNAIDRQDYDLPDCVKLVTDAVGLPDSGDDLQFVVEDAADNSSGSPDTWAETGDAFSVANGGEHSVDEFDMRGYRRHVRVTLSSGDSTLAADTEVAIEAVLSGMSTIPQD